MRRSGSVVPTIRSLCLAVISAVIAIGCAPDYFDDYKELDAVVTLQDVEYNFSDNKTYAMPDEIIDIGEDLENVEERSTANDDDILDQVADELEAYGYTRIDDVNSPDVDVIVAVGGVVQEDVTWGSYYAYSDPWTGYYWYYPVTTVVITYPVGSILIHMMDAEEIDTDQEELPSVWTAGLRAIANDRPASDVRALVSQAFTQSPYLDVSSTTNAAFGGEL